MINSCFRTGWKRTSRKLFKCIRDADFPFEADWFQPHLEFRCPFIGEISQEGVQIEVRQAIEPWYVLGEEPAGGATARDCPCDGSKTLAFRRNL
ncbi:MAG: hypothetical protein HON04_00435 [Planctomicrobium sp.]|nr:hypothetical protein [Planctomicrobium sp.]